MGLYTPALIDWFLAQQRGVAPTCQPLLAINSPACEAVHRTGAGAVCVTGCAEACGQKLIQVAWQNTANNLRGMMPGSNNWSVSAIPLVPNRTNLIIITATTTSWAPAYGGNTTFNDTLAVFQSPLRATLVGQGTNAVLNWTGGGPPYRVQRATDLTVGDWTDLLLNVTPPVTLPLPLAGPTGFYRLVGQ